jgi:hypothetical protein
MSLEGPTTAVSTVPALGLLRLRVLTSVLMHSYFVFVPKSDVRWLTPGPLACLLRPSANLRSIPLIATTLRTATNDRVVKTPD